MKYISMDTILYETGRVVGALQKVGDDDEASWLYDFALKFGARPSTMQAQVLSHNLCECAHAFDANGYERVASMIVDLVDDILTYYYLKPWMNN
jgi:hypothetical protein